MPSRSLTVSFPLSHSSSLSICLSVSPSLSSIPRRSYSLALIPTLSRLRYYSILSWFPLSRPSISPRLVLPLDFYLYATLSGPLQTLSAKVLLPPPFFIHYARTFTSASRFQSHVPIGKLTILRLEYRYWSTDTLPCVVSILGTLLVDTLIPG